MEAPNRTTSAARQVSIKALKSNAILADKCHVAECFVDRLRGLMGRRALAQGEGMLFPRCNSVHMWFMRFPIDVVFVRSAEKADGTRSFVVSSARESARPWKVFPLTDWKATETLELPAGTVRRHALEIGDELCIV